MILDSEEVVLNETQDVDEIITEYCLLLSGESPTSSTTWYTIDNLPTYIDNVGGTQYVYWMRQTINGYTNDPQPVKKTLISTQLKDKGLTTSGKTAAMVRQYGAGVLVCRKDKTVGALVNADGSFDVVEVEWNNDTPTAGAVLARYGNKLMVMKDNSGSEYLRMEDLRDSNGVVTIKETIQPVIPESTSAKAVINLEHKISSLTSVIKKTGSTNITSSCQIGSATSILCTRSLLTDGSKVVVTYTSNDPTLKAYTLGTRRSGTKAGSSFSVGTNNIVSGIYGVAIGINNTVYDDFSAAIGSNLTTGREGQFVVGKSNVRSTDKLFIVGSGGQNIFTVGEDGQIVARTSDGEYYTYINRSSNHEDLLIRNYHYYLDENDTYKSEMLSGIKTHQTGFAINGQDLFYQPTPPEVLSFKTQYISFAGHINSSKKTIRITVNTPKSLRYVSEFAIEKMTGSLMGNNGYIQHTSGTATDYTTNWLSKCNVSVVKQGDNYLVLLVTLKNDGAFANVTGATPVVFVPYAGGDGLQITIAP